MWNEYPITMIKEQTSDQDRVEQERRIGQLTGRVLAALPSEARRMYLAQPRLFVTEDAFYEAVLEANGMDAAEIRRLRESADLVESLLDIPDEAGVRGALEAGQFPVVLGGPLGHVMAAKAVALAEARQALRGLVDKPKRLKRIG